MRTLVLVGSGEFTNSMVSVDLHLLSKIKKKNIAILPTAAGLEGDYKKWIDLGEEHFNKLGANTIGLHVVKRKDTGSKEVFKKVARSSIVYFSGGEPSYLYDVLQGTKLWNMIYSGYKKGQILAGSSAGAIVMGSHTLENAQQVFFQNAPIVWKKTFRLIDYAIFPHFDFVLQEKIDIMKKVMKLAPKDVQGKWIGIDENTALVITDEKYGEVMGHGNVRVLKDGEEKVYKKGSALRL